MSIAESMLPEFDHEMANTRTCLTRIPDDRLDWRAHEKSWTLRELATHLANLPKWTVMTLQQTSFDMHPPGEEPVRADPIGSVDAVVARFDENIVAARAAIEVAGDGDFMTPWTLLNAGEAIFTMPRIAVLRGFVMNHMIHHRGQLSVYLRLNDVAVPSIYGPSADEKG